MNASRLARLDAEIARTEGILERELLKARRASLLARLGQFAEARFALAGLRSQTQRLRQTVLQAWVALIDGMIEHCEALSAGARPKFQRAHQLALEAQDAAAIAETAAWLAVTDLNASDVDATVAHAALALRLAPAEAHAACARAALVVADAWRFAGDDLRAQAWYQRVRAHASAEGDVSLVSILLYNKSAFRACRLCLDDAFGRPVSADEARQVLLEAQSTGHYDQGVGNAQLVAQVPLVCAQLMVVLGRDAEAIDIIDAQMARARAEGLAGREARLQADAALAEVRSGRHDEATRRVRRVEATLDLLSDQDDIAAAHARLASVLAALGRPEQAAAARTRADQALQAHQVEQQRWAQALEQAGLGACDPVR